MSSCPFCQRARSGACKRHAAADPVAVADVAEPAPENAPPAPAPSLDPAIAALLVDLTEQVKSLKGEVVDLRRQADQAGPRFVPMETPSRPAAPRQFVEGIQPGEDRQQVTTLPVTGTGQRVEEQYLRVFRQAFQPGDRVRIRAEATREGMGKVLEEQRDAYGRLIPGSRKIEPMSWAEVLGKMQPIRCQQKQGNRQCVGVYHPNAQCPECGAGPKVHKVRYLSKNGQWKYVVKIPGVTQMQGDGFHQDELELAR